MIEGWQGWREGRNSAVTHSSRRGGAPTTHKKMGISESPKILGKGRPGDDFMHPWLYAVAGSSLIVSAIVYKQWSTGSIFGGMERP